MTKFLRDHVWKRVWILESKNGCEKWHYWVWMGSGFGKPSGTPLPRTLRGTLPGLLVTCQLHSGWFGWAGWTLLLWALWRIAWQNSRHFARPPVVSTRNDVWETSAEIPYWWPVTTQIWVVKPLIESTTRQICLTNQTHDPDPGSDTSSVWNFCARLSDVIFRGNQWWRRQMSAVFSG